MNIARSIPASSMAPGHSTHLWRLMKMIKAGIRKTWLKPLRIVIRRKNVSYSIVLKRLLEAVNDGDLAGQDEIMEWFEAHLDDNESDDDETSEE